MEDWILNRRFFLYDTVTGIEEPGGFSTLEPASIVRYAKTMRLVVTLDANKEYNEMIYTPYLEINYEEKQKDMILEENDKMKDITFMAEYKMDTKSFWQLCKTLFWILFVVMLLNLRTDQFAPGRERMIQLIAALVGTAGLVGLLRVIPAGSGDPPPLPEAFGGYEMLGIALYTDYVLLVEMVSLLLLAAIVVVVDHGGSVLGVERDPGVFQFDQGRIESVSVSGYGFEGEPVIIFGVVDRSVVGRVHCDVGRVGCIVAMIVDNFSQFELVVAGLIPVERFDRDEIRTGFSGFPEQSRFPAHGSPD